LKRGQSWHCRRGKRPAGSLQAFQRLGAVFGRVDLMEFERVGHQKGILPGFGMMAGAVEQQQVGPAGQGAQRLVDAGGWNQLFNQGATAVKRRAAELLR